MSLSFCLEREREVGGGEREREIVSKRESESEGNCLDRRKRFGLGDDNARN